MSIDTQLLRLRDLHSGQIVKVVSITGHPQEIARVAARGLKTGEVIAVTRGGITCIVQFVDGHRLCLRMSDQLEILVSPL